MDARVAGARGGCCARAHLIAIAKAAQQSGELPRGNAERIAYLVLALAHGAADLALAGHLSAKSKGAADPEMLLDDLIRLLRTAGSLRPGG